MPSPSSALSTLRPDLASSLEEFDLLADRQNFIGIKAAPVIEVGKASGTFGRIPIEQLLQRRETRRAPGGGYSRGSWTFEPDSYACQEHGAEEPVDDRDEAMYRDYFDAELIAAQRALDAVLREQEIRLATMLFNATTWTGAGLTTAVTLEWDANDTAAAIPIHDVEGAVRKVWDATGLWPNALIINRNVFRNLRNLDQIVDRIEASGAGQAAKPGDITPQILARVFDLDYVLIGGGAYNSAKEGQTAVVSKIWSDEYAMVARVATTSDPKEPCVARIFHWAEDGSEIGGTIETYREEQTRSDIVRARNDCDEKVMYVECAHLLSNVTII